MRQTDPDVQAKITEAWYKALLHHRSEVNLFFQIRHIELLYDFFVCLHKHFTAETPQWLYQCHCDWQAISFSRLIWILSMMMPRSFYYWQFSYLLISIIIIIMTCLQNVPSSFSCLCHAGLTLNCLWITVMMTHNSYDTNIAALCERNVIVP